MAEVFDFGLQQHKIKMDGKFFENNLFAVAGDTGRRLEVQLLDSDNLVQNTTGISLRLNADVAGQATYAEAALVDATKGLYELDLPNGMLIAPGNWQFQWQIIGNTGEKLHSFTFMGSIGSNLSEGGTEATNFYLNAEDLKDMQEDFINGALDSAALITNIEEKLVELEEDYAPRLLRTEQQLPFKADTSYVDAKIGELGATANWKGSATNAVILAKTGMSIGDEWFDTTNNVSIRWNGTSWMSVGAGTKIGDESLTNAKYAPRSVTKDKTDFIEPAFINYVDGVTTREENALYDIVTGQRSTDVLFDTFIFNNLQVGKTYREYYFNVSDNTEGSSYTTFFGGSGNFISGVNSKSFVIPTGTVTVKKAFRKSLLKTPILTIFGESTNYRFTDLIPNLSIADDKGLNREKTNWYEKTQEINNLYNPLTRISGYYFDHTGKRITSAANAFGTTQKMYLKTNTTYVKKWFSNGGENNDSFITYFVEDGSEDGKVVGFIATGGEFTTPVTFDFVRLTIHALNNDIAQLYEKNDPYKVKDRRLLISKENLGSDIILPLKGKVMNVVTDSLGSTDYAKPNWWQQIASETGAVFNDYAWSGTTLAHDPLAGRHLRGPHFTDLPAGTVVGGCMVERYVNIDTSADGVIFMGGKNDGNTPRGIWDSQNEGDFFGALNIIIVGLLKMFAGKPIVFMTSMQTADAYLTNVPNPTEVLLSKDPTATLSDQLRNEAVRLKCNQYGITCIDLYNKSGINGADTNRVYYGSGDTLHPSLIGQKVIKSEVKPVLINKFS